MSSSLRIAIYARYSSDLQNPSSIDDQITACEALIVKEYGAPIAPVAVFRDEAQSGGSLFGRPGMQALMDATASGGIDLVVAEGLDRISRNLGDVAKIYERFEYQRVGVLTVHEGAVSPLHIGLKGTMNQLFLADLREKVRRAQKAQALAGRAPASIAYGYRAVRGVLDAKGRYVNGLREPDPEKAPIVKRIFEEYGRGCALREIAKDLNADGIPAPGGGLWKPHSIRGGRARGGGLLHNNLYRGWLLYNRMRKTIDPDTGKQRYVQNPESEWVWTRVEHLQIVDDETWNAVQKRLHRPEPIKNITKHKKVRKPRKYVEPPGNTHPLTGLVTCGWCNGRKSLANAGRYVCNTYRFQKRKCSNARGERESTIRELLFADLEASVEEIDCWPELIRAHFETERKHREEREKEAAAIQARIDRLLEAIENGIRVESATDKIVELQADLADRLAGRKLPRLPKTNGEARDILIAAIDHMDRNFDVRKEGVPIRNALALLVREIRLTPIEGKRSGETMEIRLKPAGWPEFYRQALTLWPVIATKKHKTREWA